MDSRLLGAFGEQTAARYLRNNGYEVLSANFRTRGGEIDIVAKKDGVVCFVEVKTRTEGSMLPPRAAVGFHKEQNVEDTAAVYMKKYGIKLKKRFDIVEVITSTSGEVVEVNHIKNAF